MRHIRPHLKRLNSKLYSENLGYSFQQNYFEIGRTGIHACSLNCDKQARMPVLPARKQLS
jgi:hypothetical protein